MNQYNSTKTDISPGIVWFYNITEQPGYETYYYDYSEYNIEDLYLLVKDNKPDYVVVLAYDKLHTELIRLREFSKIYVLQSDDRWRYANFSKFWISFVDGVITFEGELSNYISDGLQAKNFHKMRWAFNPTMMSKIENPTKFYYNISHTGGMHGNRQQLISEFNNKGIDVYNKRTNTYDETKNIWANSKYSLCFTNNSLNTGKELKGRVVEIPNWCVLVTEPFPDMEQYYDIENDIVVFNSIDEAIEKMKYLDNNQKEYNKIKENGKRKLWNQNTCFHQWNRIMSEIDEDYKQIDVNKLLKENYEIKNEIF